MLNNNHSLNTCLSFVTFQAFDFERSWWRLFWVYLMKVILSIPDEGFFRNSSCALNYISMVLFLDILVPGFTPKYSDGFCNATFIWFISSLSLSDTSTLNKSPSGWSFLITTFSGRFRTVGGKSVKKMFCKKMINILF